MSPLTQTLPDTAWGFCLGSLKCWVFGALCAPTTHTHTTDTALFCVLREARHHKHGHLGSFIRKLQFLFLLKQGFYYLFSSSPKGIFPLTFRE